MRRSSLLSVLSSLVAATHLPAAPCADINNTGFFSGGAQLSCGELSSWCTSPSYTNVSSICPVTCNTQFMLASSGTCESNGGASLTTQIECEAAAAAMPNVADATAQVISESIRPPYCYHKPVNTDPATRLFFNTGGATPCTTVRECICSACPPPQDLPPSFPPSPPPLPVSSPSPPPTSALTGGESLGLSAAEGGVSTCIYLYLR